MKRKWQVGNTLGAVERLQKAVRIRVHQSGPKSCLIYDEI
jgi:hypothetical protein